MICHESAFPLVTSIAPESLDFLEQFFVHFLGIEKDSLAVFLHGIVEIDGDFLLDLHEITVFALRIYDESDCFGMIDVNGSLDFSFDIIVIIAFEFDF